MRALSTVLVLIWASTSAAATFEAAGVNTPRGISCPALFGGKPAIAFKGEYAPQIGRILEEYAGCLAAKEALKARQDESAARKGADVAQEKASASLQVSIKTLEAALSKESERANKLQEALNSSKWRWFWSIVAGLGVGAGISLGMKALVK